MSSLAELQNRLQSALMRADETTRQQVLAALKPAAHAPKDEMFGVYYNAYRARLAEILEQDLETVAEYLGEELFAHVAAGYIDAHPSDMRNARWYSRHAADFLASTEPFSRWPQVAELAAIEIALADAFDAADAAPFMLDDLTRTPPQDWAQLAFSAHPALRRIDTATNVFDIWQALKAEAAEPEPPPPKVLDAPQPLAVWRQDAHSRLRALPPSEARGLDALLRGATFAQACEAMATGDRDEETADVNQAVTYLAGWCAAGMLVPRKPDRTTA